MHLDHFDHCEKDMRHKSESTSLDQLKPASLKQFFLFLSFSSQSRKMVNS